MLEISIKTYVTHRTSYLGQDRPEIHRDFLLSRLGKHRDLSRDPKCPSLLLVSDEQSLEMALVFLIFCSKLLISTEHNPKITRDPSLLNLLIYISSCHSLESIEICSLPFPYQLSRPNKIESSSFFFEIPFSKTLTSANNQLFLNLSFLP